MENLKDKIKNKVLFEISFEVCNKIGGIHSVITSKAKKVKDVFGENYFLIGPYLPYKRRQKEEFKEEALPLFCIDFSKELQEYGITVHKGRWLIEGQPNVFLIDYSKFWEKLNYYKKLFWEKFKVDSLNAPYDYDEPLVFSIAVGVFLEKIKNCFKDKSLIFHFHEWLTSGAILYLKLKEKQNFNKNYKTILTTHATVLGRAIASSNLCLYEDIKNIDPEKSAKALGVYNKFSLEKAGFLNCEILTTVSEITNLELKYFYKRQADKILPNGLDIKHLPTFEEVSIEHHIKREFLREFVLYYFFPYYKFGIENTLFYFTSGRAEFKNKGFDIFIKALGLLNKSLKKDKNFKKTIIVFFLVPFDNQGPNPEIFIYKEKFNEIKREILESEVDLLARIIYLIMQKRKCEFSFLFEKEKLEKIKLKINSFEVQPKQKNLAPPYSTHQVDKNNIFFKSFKDAGLLNMEQDKVKVVLIPIYLTGTDGLINLDYKGFVQGTHFGVFPSYYEPFGYTPLETAALGVPAITSDLAGYGQFIKDKIKDKKYPGIYILERFCRGEEDIIKDLYKILKQYSYFDVRGRVENKINAIKLSSFSDWQKLLKNYFELYI